MALPRRDQSDAAPIEPSLDPAGTFLDRERLRQDVRRGRQPEKRQDDDDRDADVDVTGEQRFPPDEGGCVPSRCGLRARWLPGPASF